MQPGRYAVLPFIKRGGIHRDEVFHHFRIFVLGEPAAVGNCNPYGAGEELIRTLATEPVIVGMVRVKRVSEYAHGHYFQCFWIFYLAFPCTAELRIWHIGPEPCLGTVLSAAVSVLGQNRIFVQEICRIFQIHIISLKTLYYL